jgi:hypothetical protein
MKTSEDKDAGQLKLRLPSTLKAWLTDRANENRRSLTGEVVVRLEASRTADESKAKKAKG